MRKEKDQPIFKGMWSVMYGRVKPLVFTLCFIAAFNAVCVVLFVRENYLHTIFRLFMYWWYVLYLIVAIGLFYLVYRALKSEKLFVIFLAVLAVLMATLQYLVVVEELLFFDLSFVLRALGCVAVGILLSYVPMLKPMKFNVSIPLVIILIPTLFYFAYNEKTFFIRLLMLGLFSALVYFSSHISFQSKICDYLGQLSARIYLYMAFVAMLHLLGLTHYRILFVIDVALATLDLALSIYRRKYKTLLESGKA